MSSHVITKRIILFVSAITNELENYINFSSDIDSLWWPFLMLRPQKHERISNRLLIKMSLHFGIFYGVIYGIFLGIFLYMKNISYLYIILSISAFVICFIIYFFLACKTTFVPFWNRRAERKLDALPSIKSLQNEKYGMLRILKASLYCGVYFGFILGIHMTVLFCISITLYISYKSDFQFNFDSELVSKIFSGTTLLIVLFVLFFIVFYIIFFFLIFLSKRLYNNTRKKESEKP